MPQVEPAAPVAPGDVADLWERELAPVLADYVGIPCLSPAYDPEWSSRRELARAAELLRSWCAARPLPGLQARVETLPGRTPLLVVDVPPWPAGADDGPDGTERPVLIYGHFDKQPPLGEWRSGLGPFLPVREGDRLYGRGAADDGYAALAALGALELLHRGGVPRPRVVVLVEGSEESGSPDLDAHLTALADRLGVPRLVVCLDSGCLTYDRLWLTTSLRGNLVATVRADVLDQGVHSGLAGGLVPSSFRVVRQLLDRLEDPLTGEVLLPELRADVPERQRRRLESVAEDLGDVATGGLPVVAGLELSGATPGERLVRRAWAPALAVTGIDGVPAVRDAGNVLRPYTAVKVSLRLPPSVSSDVAARALVAALTTKPPEGARVRVDVEAPADGWLAPEPEPWLARAVDAASVACFGRPSASYGEGGTIPFLASLGARFPGIPFVAAGVLGPESNAHGPNEFLHVPMAHAVTVAVGHMVAAAAGHR